jgi:hypothetical protein
VFNAGNIVKVAAAIVKLEDGEDLDKKLDATLQQLRQAGLGNVSIEILRVVTRKLALQPSEIPATDNDCAAEQAIEIDIHRHEENVISNATPPSKKQRTEGGFDVDRQLGNNLDTNAKLAKLRLINEQLMGRNMSSQELFGTFITQL